MKDFIRLCSVGLLAGMMIACSSQGEKKQTRADSLVASGSDSLQPLMAKTQANLRYLARGLLSFDRAGLEKSSANLLQITRYVRDSKHKPQGKKVDWQLLCDEQESLLEDMRREFGAQNYAAAADAFGKLVVVCVRCHEPYRKFG